MDRDTVSAIVRDALANYRYAPPTAETIGTSFSAETVTGFLTQLREVLVQPSLQRFELRDTYQQVTATDPVFADYWVVAVMPGYLEWFDPTTGEFGLAAVGDGDAPVTFGVRGDLVGVFCAM